MQQLQTELRLWFFSSPKSSAALESIDSCALPSASPALSKVRLLALFFNPALYCSPYVHPMSFPPWDHPQWLLKRDFSCVWNIHLCSWPLSAPPHIKSLLFNSSYTTCTGITVFVQDTVNAGQKHPHAVSASRFAGEFCFVTGGLLDTNLSPTHMVSRVSPDLFLSSLFAECLAFPTFHFPPIELL